MTTIPTPLWHMRKATVNDVKTIMHMITAAQSYLAQQGINQWQNGYPNYAVITNDIAQENSYVIENTANKIVATAMIAYDNEPTYTHIDGAWLGNNKKCYAVIHRIAIDPLFRRRGLAAFILQEVWANLEDHKAYSIRIDTHKDNIVMQKLAEKLDFHYCGIIRVKDGSTRLAYEKVKNL